MNVEGDGPSAGNGAPPEPAPCAADLPAVLARLDADDRETRRAAVEHVASAVDERPGAYVPTAPKLRAILEREAADAHETVAYCLAELAAASPDDVAPSVDAVVAFAVDRTPHPATADSLRCLAHVAAGRPAAVVGHVGAVVDVTAAAEATEARRRGVALLARLSREHPHTTEPAADRLRALFADLAADPEPAVRERARRALSRFEGTPETEPPLTNQSLVVSTNR